MNFLLKVSAILLVLALSSEASNDTIRSTTFNETIIPKAVELNVTRKSLNETVREIQVTPGSGDFFLTTKPFIRRDDGESGEDDTVKREFNVTTRSLLNETIIPKEVFMNESILVVPKSVEMNVTRKSLNETVVSKSLESNSTIIRRDEGEDDVATREFNVTSRSLLNETVIPKEVFMNESILESKQDRDIQVTPMPSGVFGSTKPVIRRDGDDKAARDFNVTSRSLLNETIIPKEVELNSTVIRKDDGEDVETRGLNVTTKSLNETVIKRSVELNVTTKSLNETLIPKSVELNASSIRRGDGEDFVPREVNVTSRSLFNETLSPKALLLNETIVEKSILLNDTIPKSVEFNVTSRSLFNETVIPKEVLLNETVVRKSTEFNVTTRGSLNETVIRKSVFLNETVIPKSVDMNVTTRSLNETVVPKSVEFNVTSRSLLNETVIPKEAFLNETVIRKSAEFNVTTKSLNDTLVRKAAELNETVVPKSVTEFIMTTTRPIILKSVELISNSTRALRDLVFSKSVATSVLPEDVSILPKRSHSANHTEA